MDSSKQRRNTVMWRYWFVQKKYFSPELCTKPILIPTLSPQLWRVCGWFRLKSYKTGRLEAKDNTQTPLSWSRCDGPESQSAAVFSFYFSSVCNLMDVAPSDYLGGHFDILSYIPFILKKHYCQSGSRDSSVPPTLWRINAFWVADKCLEAPPALQ